MGREEHITVQIGDTAHREEIQSTGENYTKNRFYTYGYQKNIRYFFVTLNTHDGVQEISACMCRL
jgi:hypothetical protein